jgi:hypothetical protein
MQGEGYAGRGISRETAEYLLTVLQIHLGPEGAKGTEGYWGKRNRVD